MKKMYKKKMKGLMRDTMMVGMTGVGLGMLSSVDPTGAKAIAPMSRGIGTVGSVMMLGYGVGMMQDTVNMVDKKMKKKKMRY